MAHALMQNRQGLIVDGERMLTSATVELKMIKRCLKAKSTLGTDKAYNVKELLGELDAGDINLLLLATQQSIVAAQSAMK